MFGPPTKTATVRGAIALAAASLPFLVSWVALAALIASREAARPPSGSPNPAKAPVWMLAPGGFLVYADPYLAGTMYLWPWFGAAVLVAWVAWSVATTARGGPAGDASRRGWLRLIATSIAVGFVVAAPWYYALFRICVGRLHSPSIVTAKLQVSSTVPGTFSALHTPPRRRPAC